MLATKYSQNARSMKTQCDFLNGWIANGHKGKNLTKMVNLRDVVAERRRRRRRRRTVTEVFIGDV